MHSMEHIRLNSAAPCCRTLLLGLLLAMATSGCVAPTLIGSAESHRRLWRSDEAGSAQTQGALDAGAMGAFLTGSDGLETGLVGGQAQYRAALSEDLELRLGGFGAGSADGEMIAGAVNFGAKYWVSEHWALNFDGSLGVSIYEDGEDDEEEDGDFDLDFDDGGVVGGGGLGIGAVWVPIVDHLLEPYFAARFALWAPIFATTLDLGIGLNVYASENVRFGVELGALEILALGYLPAMPIPRGNLSVGFLF